MPAVIYIKKSRFFPVFLTWWLCMSFWVCPQWGYGNDTIFIARHHFDEPVNNVFLAEGRIYAKVGSHIYKRSEGQWEKMSGEYKKYFVFYSNGFYEHEYIPKEHLIEDIRYMADLIPQKALTNATAAMDGNVLFVSVGGSLYEYLINTSYSLMFADKSIRHTYKDDNLIVYSTYGAIYVNRDRGNTVVARGLKHSNGNFVRTSYGDIIASDYLFQLYQDDSISRMAVDFGLQQGKVRKAINHRDTLLLMLTNSICTYHPSTGVQTLALNHEFTDLEWVNNALVFCTAEGKLFSRQEGNITELLDLHEKLRDIFPMPDGLFLAGSTGVFFYSFKEKKITRMIDVKGAAAMVIDMEQNLWIGSDFGLYIIPKDEQLKIPFIPNVEFNRGALTYYNDTIFAGSIHGLYLIDAYTTSKSTIPAAIHKVKVYNRNLTIAGLVGLVVLSIGAWLTIVYIRKRRKIAVPAEARPTKRLGLADIERDILEQNIQTVDGLADHLHTNTVQLNRIFKSFNTTPGKFLKSVKMKLARQMLRDGKTMQDVVSVTGYSAQLIKTELKKKGELKEPD